jgi:hypothetical protein
MYLREGKVEPGDKAKVARFETKIFDWKRDVLKGTNNQPTTTEDLSASNMFQLQNNFNGYWCVKERSVGERGLTGLSMQARPTAGTACTTIRVHATLHWYGMRKRRPTTAFFYPAMVRQRRTFG